MRSILRDGDPCWRCWAKSNKRILAACSVPGATGLREKARMRSQKMEPKVRCQNAARLCMGSWTGQWQVGLGSQEITMWCMLCWVKRESSDSGLYWAVTATGALAQPVAMFQSVLGMACWDSGQLIQVVPSPMCHPPELSHRRA